MKKIDMEAAFATIPDVPEGFEDYCYNALPPIAIYYKRGKKMADCLCGKCGRLYVTGETPVRGENATCPICGNTGIWEWQRVKRCSFTLKDIVLLQCTTDKKLVLRVFRIIQNFKQGHIAEQELKEIKRWFLHLGDVYKFCYEYRYVNGKSVRTWDYGGGSEPVYIDRWYYTWRRELEKSELKYCDVDAINRCRVEYDMDRLGILETYANNPALEMFEKTGMQELVRFLVRKKGKTKLINRRGKSMSAQLRLKDKQMVKRVIQKNGDIRWLEVLQEEQKHGYHWTEEQEWFMAEMYGKYRVAEQIEHCLKYMTLQQLINRLEKYKKQQGHTTTYLTLGTYSDYLGMREELGYDMTNSVFTYPKNLKEKHDEMVAERNARRDELHMAKMKVKFPEIEKRHKSLLKKYGFEDENYIIRPARSAEEIIREGQTLHHCVGRETYLERHNTGKSYILFLRHKETPDTPYYTIEIRSKTIVQWYGAYDKKPDKETIEKWLAEYMIHLKVKNMRKAG